MKKDTSILLSQSNEQKKRYSQELFSSLTDEEKEATLRFAKQLIMSRSLAGNK